MLLMSSTRGAAFWLLRLDRQWAATAAIFGQWRVLTGAVLNVLRARLAIENGGRIVPFGKLKGAARRTACAVRL